jgi:hypothetical protein
MIQIAEPAAANDLFDLAVELAPRNRRLLFFCSCQWPRWKGGRCHRTAIAELILEIAKERRVPTQVIEWPGHEPSLIDLAVIPEVFQAVLRGRQTVPVGRSHRLDEIAGLPWCSIARLHSNDDEIIRVVGPVAWRLGEWSLPILWAPDDPQMSMHDCRRKARKMRQVMGLDAAG